MPFCTTHTTPRGQPIPRWNLRILEPPTGTPLTGEPLRTQKSGTPFPIFRKPRILISESDPRHNHKEEGTHTYDHPRGGGAAGWNLEISDRAGACPLGRGTFEGGKKWRDTQPDRWQDRAQVRRVKCKRDGLHWQGMNRILPYAHCLKLSLAQRVTSRNNNPHSARRC
jgi:hypothetical protein